MEMYIFGFFVWWYSYVCQESGAQFWRQAQSLGIRIRLIPMVQYFFVPLFGDTSFGGRFIGMFIRFWWILFALIPFVFFIVPLMIAWIGLCILPVVTIGYTGLTLIIGM